MAAASKKSSARLLAFLAGIPGIFVAVVWLLSWQFDRRQDTESPSTISPQPEEVHPSDTVHEPTPVLPAAMPEIPRTEGHNPGTRPVRTVVDEGALHSYVWLSRSQDEASLDLSQAETCLERAESYQLKLAFHRGAIADWRPSALASFHETGQERPTDSGLEVSYYSADLIPSSGNLSLRLPRSGATQLLSFDVLPASPSRDTALISYRIAVDSTPLETGDLELPIVQRGSPCPLEMDVRRTKSERKITTKQRSVAELCNEARRNERILRILITPPADPYQGFPIRVTWKYPVDGVTSSAIDLQTTLKSIGNAVDKLYYGDGGDPRGELKATDGLTIGEGERQTILEQLAEHGFDLYNKLFPLDKNPDEENPRDVLDELRQQPADEAPTLVEIDYAPAARTSGRLVIPFGLIFDDSEFFRNRQEHESVPITGFWDYRYRVDQTYRNMVCRRASLCSNQPSEVAAALDEDGLSSTPWDDQVRRQKDLLEKILPRKPRILKNEVQWRDVLRGKVSETGHPFDFLYFYGHTHNDFGFDLTDSSLTPLALRNDRSASPSAKPKGYPVVFVNSCGSAVATTFGDSQTLVEEMAERNVTAYIGTTATVLPNFASDLAMQFFCCMQSRSEPTPLGTVLWRVKRSVLEREDGNPLVMLYQMLGNSDVMTCGSPTVAAGGPCESLDACMAGTKEDS